MTANVINTTERGKVATVYLTADGKLMRDAGRNERLFCMSFTHRQNGSVALGLEHASGVDIQQEYMFRGGRICRDHVTTKAFPKEKKQVLSASDRVGGHWVFRIGNTGSQISVSNDHGVMVIRHQRDESATEDQRAEDVEGVLLTLARGQRPMQQVVAAACH